ncbi:MAG TPA: alkaline phosphatase family protein [Gemmatimonadales bacterium]
MLVLIDGARVDVLRALLDRGDLPNLARWVIEPGGLTTGTTVFPSTTGVAYIPFLFGRYPGSVGVPGIRWLDRRGAANGMGWGEQWRAARSYCGAQGAWLNSDIAPTAPSLFDLVPESIAICTPVTRGLRSGANRIALQRAILGSAAHYLGTYEALDRAVARTWIAAAREPWRFLLVVFPGIDGIAHLKDPFHPRVLESYRLVDRALGAFVAGLRRQGGELPAMFVVSDHGMTAMREHHDVAELLERQNVRTLRHPLRVWRRDAGAATMVSGNASVQLYFEPRSGRGKPLEESNIPQSILDALLAMPSVRLAAYRADDEGIVIRTRESRALLTDAGGSIRYQPQDGDPLGLGGYVERDDRELLALSRETDVPDAPRQLLQLFQTPRSGDVVLAAESGFDFRGPWEIPEHRAGHGSLIAEHMHVPIATNVALPDSPIRTVDLMPTVLECLDVPVPSGIALDGAPFSKIAAVEPLTR